MTHARGTVAYSKSALEDVLGLLALAGYIAGVVALAAGVTWTVIKIFPTERKPKDGEEQVRQEKPSRNGGTEPEQGRLFRRSKRSR